MITYENKTLTNDIKL